jgi:hypothetical protein
VRDRFHYRSPIFCTAAAAVRALEASLSAGEKAGAGADKSRRRNRAGQRGFSTMHIRRGDFQYKQVAQRRLFCCFCFVFSSRQECCCLRVLN